MLKRTLSLLLAGIICVFLFAACTNNKQNNGQSGAQDNAEKQRTEIKLASLKGPTTMGMVKLMADAEAKTSANDYQVAMSGTADEIVTKIVNKDIDVAAVPCNLASVLYNKTKGAIQVAAVNTLGVLYMVETGDHINSVADLKGKTIYTTGKGTTPEYVLNYILNANGIDPLKDVTIEFKSEATEVAALLSADEKIVGMLPQPFVATAQAKNEKLRVALDMTQEWDRIQAQDGGALVTGVVIVRKEFLEKNKDAFDKFLEEYKASTQYVNNNVNEAAALVDKYGIVNQAVAKVAIPECNITFIDKQEMQDKVSGYLNVLFDQNPQSVGGTLPDGEFYYKG